MPTCLVLLAWGIVHIFADADASLVCPNPCQAPVIFLPKTWA